MNISPQKAKNMMDKSEKFILLDVRREAEFAEGHIPNAVLIPHTEIEERAENEIPDKNTPVFVYCRSGRRSFAAAEILLELGYKEVFDFGGINRWPYKIVK